MIIEPLRPALPGGEPVTCASFPGRWLYPALFLISMAAIGYELLLMRLLSIIQWHHFGYMIISLALLGYGASGTFIALVKDRIGDRFLFAFSANALLFALAMPLCFLVGQWLPFNALEVIWSRQQWGYLLLLYLLFFLPFFFAANALGLSFVCFARRIGALYRADLLGAGLGALLAMVALFLFSPQRCLPLLALLPLAAVALLWRSGITRAGWLVIGLCLTLVVALSVVGVPLRISPYKGLSQALQIGGGQTLAQYSSPLALLTLVDNPRFPLRHAPGMSLLSRQPPPPQQALFFDGDGLSPINNASNRGGDDATWLGYLDYLPQVLPYRLRSRPRVLILGLGGGVDLQLALRQGASQVEVVELNPQVVGLVGAGLAAAAGRVRIRVAEARGFVARSRDSYDLIQLSMMDSFTASAAGVQALSESYLYTVEAFEAYLARLAPGGVLMVTRWLKIPPRDSLKLFATAVAALSRAGVEDPGRQLVLIRSWNTSTLLVRKGAFGPTEIAALRAFCDEMAFDTAYFPGIHAAQANRFNRLQSPYLFQGARALLSERATAFLADYKFRLHPATEDRPHFFHFLRWSTLPELLRLRHQGGAALLELGYLILVVTLAQALLAGGLLILLPLWAARDAGVKRGGWRLQGYFLLLGLAFIFIEIAFIQKFMLLLNHPLYAVAVVLAGFLGFAGLGSGAVDALTRARPPGWPSLLTLAVAAILLLATLYLEWLPSLFEQLLRLPDALRIGFCLLLLGPLAFFMGMPFPIGLALVADRAPAFLPWAWGLNGFASVLGATLATLLAIELGFRAIVLIALGLYVLAAILLSAEGRSSVKG